jgi:hypothetical protein
MIGDPKTPYGPTPDGHEHFPASQNPAPTGALGWLGSVIASHRKKSFKAKRGQLRAPAFSPGQESE